MRSGILRQNFTMDASNINKSASYHRSKKGALYAEYVHEGTGVYDKRKTPRSFLKPKKPSKPHTDFIKSVKGQKPNKFLERAA
ncbi:MAG: hypothetical protein LBU73_01630 [Helicobacteraceae bacterium]|nr:hypothetical protein [Helicobacteraceae bacterium]